MKQQEEAINVASSDFEKVRAAQSCSWSQHWVETELIVEPAKCHVQRMIDKGTEPNPCSLAKGVPPDLRRRRLRLEGEISCLSLHSAHKYQGTRTNIEVISAGNQWLRANPTRPPSPSFEHSSNRSCAGATMRHELVRVSKISGQAKRDSAGRVGQDPDKKRSRGKNLTSHKEEAAAGALPVLTFGEEWAPVQR
ncbi:uncharacterized protein TRIVIDRAFT_61459 [Trichoderma virens Gv29-8]|uniref:Uncharacterized protein n=1 Tax=Hypocrea virens (strain Gv29-8 / FGSC 10586) TaxID=413071 RepID=G9MMW4_HYPVG|nr:uncharacterized protein TRIVIDRAFT_61459 [Trichoderma virens Gv29-8]EHK24682.1 hypothetical protein TRIVIDRAFT_61459 [Trichoderma virens Gv29-8]UKZ54947.1 hypothetical protein TrVGV298_008761 [Trichoderma virens]